MQPESSNKSGNQSQMAALDVLEASSGKGRQVKRPLYMLAVAFAATVATMIFVFVLLWTLRPVSIVSQDANLCQSSACIGASAMLQRNMDLSVDPCQDFYKFACGGFEQMPYDAETILRGLRSHTESRVTMNAQLFEILYNKKLVKSDDPELNSLFQAVRTLFQSCVAWYSPGYFWLQNTTESLWHRGSLWANKTTLVEPLLEIFKANLDVEELFAQLIKAGISQFIEISYQLNIYASFTNNSHELESKSLALVFSCMRLDEAIYTDSMSAENFESAKKYFPSSPIASRLILVHYLVTEIMSQNDINSDIFYGNLTDLQSTTDAYISPSTFNWTKFIGFFFDQPLGPEVPVIVNRFGIFLNVVKLLKPELSVRSGLFYDWVRVDSILFRMIEYVTPSVDPSGVKFCMDQWIIPHLQVVHRMYKSIYMDYNVSLIYSLVTDIKNAMKQNIDSEDWIHYNTKVALKLWIDNMKQTVSYFEIPLDELKCLYRPAIALLREAKHFGDIITVQTAVKIQNTLLILTCKSSPDLFIQTSKWPFKVNAYFDTSDNGIHILTGILTFLFNKDYPEYLTYGGIGSVIGHEIAHGIGEPFGYGSRRPETPFGVEFDNGTLAAFEIKKQCLANSYGQMYFTPNHTVNASLTMYENLADILGINAAFRAYKNQMLSAGRGPMRIPGDLLSTLSDEKLFFIQSSQFWCSRMEKYILQHYSSDSHSPPKQRALGSMMHSMWFAEIFGCRAGDPMYLGEGQKCRIW